MTLGLPWPPSVNTYWRAFAQNTRKGLRVRKIISEKGRKYREQTEAVGALHVRIAADKRLAVVLDAFPPDRRKRDLDNVPKAVLDALTHAGIYTDDSQIDDLRIRRRPVVKGGRIEVTISEIRPA